MKLLPLLTASAVVTLLVAPGCFGHECEGDKIEIVHDPTSRVTQGDFVDDGTWESSPVSATWLEFSGQRTIHVRIVPWEQEGRTFGAMTGYISNAAVPNAVRADGQHDNWTVGAGNLLEYRDVSPGNVSVTNATCQTFYLRLVLHAAPPEEPDAGPDAPADATGE
jgi:hypothetical protein